ncbi:hypothetical protein Patl1_05491 [Pistacia atlantica]|uniref:Uncharacterized protein n=1 Tax=Pistacia atlantica TaxID=434234 RepID=A0ACC1BWE4_9ROSI|nr:hypothetical protein Patl1_05491 [Pistacia atlantica]
MNDSGVKDMVRLGSARGSVAAAAPDSRDGKEDKTWLKISEWLAKQMSGAVIYAAFGSELTLSRNELTELALGLELSGLPFFWALRNWDDSIVLPDGFEERVKGRGVVWTSWAPQLRILAHESVGAFLTHCGFSSITESLYYGHPLVLLPFSIDQGLIARVFAEKKAGIEIARNEEDGEYTRKSVAEALRLVIVEEGGIYREKAKELRILFADEELHDEYVKKFVEFLQNHK